jgi:hypothetical protein
LGAGPTADAGAVALDVAATVEFAGDGTAGGRPQRAEFDDERGYIDGPIRVRIAAGATGRSGVGLALSATLEGIRLKFIAARVSESEFADGSDGAALARAEEVEGVTDEGSGQTLDEPKFSMTASERRKGGLNALL